METPVCGNQRLDEAVQTVFEESSGISDDDIKVRFIGDTEAFSPELRQLIEETRKSRKDRTGMVLNIAMNYGGRDEILRAVKQISQEAAAGRLRQQDITEELFAGHLYTAGQPDPDLIIRPSGEQRISNFLLWQSAYTEYIIMDILWSDFKTTDLEAALMNTQNATVGLEGFKWRND